MSQASDLIKIDDIHAGYGRKKILFGVSMVIHEGEVAVLIGPNGSGKSTLLKVIGGLLQPWQGRVYFKGRDITQISTDARVRLGLGYFLQGGEIFRSLRVQENLEVGGMGLSRIDFNRARKEIFDLFPQLRAYQNRRAGELSGGEKQALALAMVLLRRPQLLLLDEPSAGLAPALVEAMIKKIENVRKILGTTILLVEQNVREALRIATTVFIIKKGVILSQEEPDVVLEKGKLVEVFFR
ncbi:MAG: ATP-binding cassette domain-containing protein [candidate division WOR-3 bacterium]